MKSIFFLSRYNSTRTSYWSGIPYFARQKLDQNFDVIELNPAENIAFQFFERLFSWLRRRFAFRYHFQDSLLSGILAAPYILYTIHIKHRNKATALVAMAGSSELLFVPKKVRVILFADATMEQLFDFYPTYKDIFGWSKWESCSVNISMLNSLHHAFFTSNWALSHARQISTLNSTNSSLAYFGPNLPDQYSSNLIDQRCEEQTLKFLFPTTSWERKGGEEAIRFLTHLSEKITTPIELIVFGQTSSSLDFNGFVIHQLGWIDKSNERQLNKLIKAYQTCHFLILPTKADTTPVSIVEAFCYALPVIATNVGGIKEMFNNSQAGFMYDMQDMGSAIQWVQQHNRNDSYKKAALDSRKQFEKKYNWNQWVEKMQGVLHVND